jgi:hypothetical protein
VATSTSKLFWADALPEIGRASLSGTEVDAPLIPGVGDCGLAISGSHLFWTNFDGSIGRATLEGTEVDPSLVTGLLHPCGIAVHEGKIYWTEQPFNAIGSISRASVDGSGVERGIVPGIRSPCGIAVDNLAVPPRPVAAPGELSLTSVRRNRRSATTLVRLTVSMPGRLAINVPLGIRYRFLGDGDGEVDAGNHWLQLAPRRGFPNSWPRTGLRRKGKVQVTLRIGYAPAVGAPAFMVKKVSMVRARSGHSKR